MTAVVKYEEPSNELIFTPDKIQLLQDTICKGSTPEEFQLFLHACKRTGLDPFMKQVYAVKRWDSKLKRDSMTIQTGIDGYRLIADRTGLYSPGRESTFSYDKNGCLLSATAYVKKQTKDGTWHEISCSAFYSEYCQRDREGNPTQMWNKMPHVMLSKVAEALALRKAFPAELSGVYTKEEMEQSETIDAKATRTPDVPALSFNRITPEQANEIELLVQQCPKAAIETIERNMNKAGFKSYSDFTIEYFNHLKNKLVEGLKAKQEPQEEQVDE